MDILEKIYQAKKTLNKNIVETPLVSSSIVNEFLNKNVFFKLETLQHTGSFKYRGALNALENLKKNKVKSVVTYSSGNHGQAISAAAKVLGMKSIVIMPKDAPKLKIERTKFFGSEIIFFDRNHESREIIGNKISKEFSIPLIKPYDDYDVIAGQGTVGLEIHEQLKNENLTEAEVLVCCGGGGLSAGIALALSSKKEKYLVRTCEPDNYDDTKKSLELEKRIYVTEFKKSICDSLLSKTPGELTLPILKKLAGKGFSVSDQEVLFSMAFAFKHLKIVSEPGGAVALASTIFRTNQISSKNVVVVITGGNVDIKLFQKALRVKID